MRTPTRTLSTREAAMVGTRARQIDTLAEGERVTLEYRKADGTDSSSTGTVVERGGTGNHAYVKVEADGKGFRTINLYNVSRVVRL